MLTSTTDVMQGDIADETLFKKVLWRVLPFLLICYFFAYLDRVNVAFAKLQMAEQLRFSDVVYGLGAGIFFIGYFIFEIPSNLILERVGARRWIARIMITWGVLSPAWPLSHPRTSFTSCASCWVSRRQASSRAYCCISATGSRTRSGVALSLF